MSGKDRASPLTGVCPVCQARFRLGSESRLPTTAPRGRRRRLRTASLPRMRTAPIAAGSLIAGYAIAAKSGVRPLGGGVLLAGTAYCAREWKRRNGLLAAVGLVAVQTAAFVASHRLAPRIGAWPSVIAVATASGAAAATADRAATNPR
jgi:hypothetical protein